MLVFLIRKKAITANNGTERTLPYLKYSGMDILNLEILNWIIAKVSTAFCNRRIWDAKFLRETLESKINIDNK